MQRGEFSWKGLVVGMNEIMVADYTIDSPVIYTPRILYGVETIVEVQRGKLPSIIEGVTKAGVNVLWVCDPMHGNTFESKNGYKTRLFDDVLDVFT